MKQLSQNAAISEVIINVLDDLTHKDALCILAALSAHYIEKSHIDQPKSQEEALKHHQGLISIGIHQVFMARRKKILETTT